MVSGCRFQVAGFKFKGREGGKNEEISVCRFALRFTSAALRRLHMLLYRLIFIIKSFGKRHGENT
jgi:hypothetical protein